MAKQAKTEQTAKDQYEAKLAELETTSAKIRYLGSQGLSRGAIAKRLGIRYQHVRNVEITPIKKAKEQI